MSTHEYDVEIAILLDLIRHYCDDTFVNKFIKLSINLKSGCKTDNSPVLARNHVGTTGHQMSFGFAVVTNPLLVCNLALSINEDKISVTCIFNFHRAVKLCVPIVERLRGYLYDIELPAAINTHMSSGLRYSVSLHDIDYKQNHLLFMKRFINLLLELNTSWSTTVT